MRIFPALLVLSTTWFLGYLVVYTYSIYAYIYVQIPLLLKENLYNITIISGKEPGASRIYGRREPH
jgi:hypothetical protein